MTKSTNMILKEIREEVDEEMAIKNGCPISIIAFNKLRNLEELHRLHEIYFVGRTHKNYQSLSCKIIKNQSEIYYKSLAEKSKK